MVIPGIFVYLWNNYNTKSVVFWRLVQRKWYLEQSVSSCPWKSLWIAADSRSSSVFEHYVRLEGVLNKSAFMDNILCPYFLEILKYSLRVKANTFKMIAESTFLQNYEGHMKLK